MKFTPNQLPLFDSYNGQFVSPRLALGCCPMPENVETIATCGIRGILNLVAVCDARAMAYVSRLPHNIYWYHIAFWDGWLGRNTPAYIERLTDGYARLIVERAAEVLRDRSPVLVHCMGGVGRAGNMATILLAASEGMTIEEANDHIRQYRPHVARFAHDGFWKEAGGEAMVELAREVLARPSFFPPNISLFLCDSWLVSKQNRDCAIGSAPYIGSDRSDGWLPLTAESEFVDVHGCSAPNGVVYLKRKIEVPQAGQWIMHLGHDGGARVFVDGTAVATATGTINPAPFMRTQVCLQLREGVHEVLIALDRAQGLGWGIYLSFEPGPSMQVIGQTTVFPR